MKDFFYDVLYYIKEIIVIAVAFLVGMLTIIIAGSVMIVPIILGVIFSSVWYLFLISISVPLGIALGDVLFELGEDIIYCS